MFDRIGEKIKGLVVALCWIDIIASCLSAIILWLQNSHHQLTVGTDILVLIWGCLGSWVGSFITYGFGE